MPNIQHEHTISSRVREALRLATERSAFIQYYPSHDGSESGVAALKEEVELLNSVAHELLEALALM